MQLAPRNDKLYYCYVALMVSCGGGIFMIRMLCVLGVVVGWPVLLWGHIPLSSELAFPVWVLTVMLPFSFLGAFFRRVAYETARR